MDGWHTCRGQAKRRRTGAIMVVLAIVLSSCSTVYDMGVVREDDKLVALSACDNDQQLQSVFVRARRTDGDVAGPVIWSAVVLDETADGEESIELGVVDPDLFLHEFVSPIPLDTDLLVEGAYSDTSAGSVVVSPDQLGADEVATTSGVVSRSDFEDDRRGCGNISFGFLWPVLWVLLSLVVAAGIIAAIGARIDARRSSSEEARWDAEDRAEREARAKRRAKEQQFATPERPPQQQRPRRPRPPQQPPES